MKTLIKQQVQHSLHSKTTHSQIQSRSFRLVVSSQHQGQRFPTPFTHAKQTSPQHRSRSPQASAPSDQINASSQDEADNQGEYCLPAYVIIDNKANPNFTVMEVEVKDFPGLMRVLAWVLNGLDMIAQNAILRTTPDGTAHNTFWLTTRRGKKLSDSGAESLADRVRDFVAYCTPKPGVQNKTEFAAGPITISNTEHDAYTVITVKEQQRTPGYLLDIASIMSGLNVEVLQGIIQGCNDCGRDVPSVTSDPFPADGGRLFKFWVRDKNQNKLEYGDITALMYTLSIGLGFNGFPTTPLEQEIGIGIDGRLN